MVELKEQIVGVAIVYNCDIYIDMKPNRHHHTIRRVSKLHGGINGSHIEGFFTDQYRFLYRTEAMILAIDNGQLKRSNNPLHYANKNPLFWSGLLCFHLHPCKIFILRLRCFQVANDCIARLRFCRRYTD